MVFPQLFLGGFLPTSEMKAAGPNREAPCPVAWRNRWFSGRPRHWGPVVSNTVDGRHPTNQLRLVVYPFFSRVIYIYHHSTNNKTLFWTRCVWLTIFWKCKTFLVCRPICIEQFIALLWGGRCAKEYVFERQWNGKCSFRLPSWDTFNWYQPRCAGTF